MCMDGSSSGVGWMQNIMMQAQASKAAMEAAAAAPQAAGSPASATGAANVAAGPQAAKTAGLYSTTNRGGGDGAPGGGGTSLTGTMGVDPRTLLLGKTTLLGG